MKILILNQAFYPDVVSTAQHAADAARELAARGHDVTVIASRGAYDNPAVRFHPSEWWQGVRILRVRCTAFGKKSKWSRAADFGSFTATAATTAFTSGRYDAVLALTSPPLIATIGAALRWIRGSRLFFWVMDLNPDEAIAAGWLKERAILTRLLRALQTWNLRSSTAVIALDDFMRDRLCRAGVPASSIHVIAPWSHDESLSYDEAGRKQFRESHGMTGKFVVMYSGNHSPCHPLATLLEAAERLREHDEILFAFIGGGSEFATVRKFAEERSLGNILCLPYRPLSELSASLSAADLHAVVMGDPFAGIVHPCKVYNVLRLGIPLLYIGPSRSHITELAHPDAIGTSVYIAGHGDVERAAAHILAVARLGCGRRHAQLIEISERFSQTHLLPAFADVIDGRARTRAAAQASSAFTSRLQSKSER